MNPTVNGCCNICGDAGFAEALTTCCKCSSQEHLYCMQIFHREQPTEWYCEDCEQEKEATRPTSDTREDLATTSTFKMSGKVHNVSRRFADPSSSKAGFNKVLPKWQRPPSSARVKFISVAEAIKLPSGSKKSDQALINTSRSSPVLAKTTGKFASPVMNMRSIQPLNGHKHTADTRTQTREETQLKKAFSTPSPLVGSGSKTKSGNFVAESPTVKQPRDPLTDVGHLKSAEAKVAQAMKDASPIPNRSTGFAPRVEVAPDEALSPPSRSTDWSSRIISGNFKAQANKGKQIQNIQPGNRLSEVADVETAEAKVEQVMKKASPRPKSPNTSTIGAQKLGDVYTNIQHESSEAEKDNLENFQQNEENNRVPARDASWKGSFKMLSAECYNGLCSDIQGCPPSKVLKKVYEMLNRMPEILQFQLIPRENLWKNIFQDRCPDFDDVGLFFFPIENKRCNNYFTWTEFIGKNDLVMRMSMQGVELLVFTSAHLHTNYQTWDRAHFFWGLFRDENLKVSVADNIDISGLCPLNEAWSCSSEGDDSQVVDMEIDMEGGVAIGVLDIFKKRSLKDHSGASREPANTDVTSPPMALTGVGEEPPVTVSSTDSPGIPPGFESQKPKKKVHIETSKNVTFSRSPSFSPRTTNYAPGMASREDPNLGDPLDVKMESEKL